jgi:hypothetical protein
VSFVAELQATTDGKFSAFLAVFPPWNSLKASRALMMKSRVQYSIANILGTAAGTVFNEETKRTSVKLVQHQKSYVRLVRACEVSLPGMLAPCTSLFSICVNQSVNPLVHKSIIDRSSLQI